MRTYYKIITRYGDCYKCDKDGYVLEYSNGLKKDENSNDRKSWQITGVYYNIGWHSYCLPLDEAIRSNNFTLGNGYPRYGLTDIDHGTTRHHGNKNVHGVRSIEKIKE